MRAWCNCSGANWAVIGHARAATHCLNPSSIEVSVAHPVGVEEWLGGGYVHDDNPVLLVTPVLGWYFRHKQYPDWFPGSESVRVIASGWVYLSEDVARNILRNLNKKELSKLIIQRIIERY